MENVHRVISVGVGPGSDIAAFLAYIRCRGVANRLVYYAIDQSEGWSTFLSAFDRRWSMVHNISVWFKPWRFGKRDDVACLPDADMMVFSFSNTTLMDKAIWPLLIEKYKFILVLDGMKDVSSVEYQMFMRTWTCIEDYSYFLESCDKSGCRWIRWFSPVGEDNRILLLWG